MGAGVVLALIPIPVVTQAIGGSLIALGAGIATGVVGAGLFAYGVVKTVSKPQQSDNNPQGVTPNDNVNHGPQSIIEGLGVTQEILDKANASNEPLLPAESASVTSNASEGNVIIAEEKTAPVPPQQLH